MHRRLRTATLLAFVLWLAVRWPIRSTAQEAPPAPSLTIQLPHDIAPERVAIFYSLIERGSPESITTKPGMFDYTVETGTARNTKLLLFVPGFRVVTAEFTDGDVRAAGAYTPRLVPSRATLSGRLVDSAGQSLRNYGLTLGYRFIETCTFFKCGGDGPIPVVSLGVARTDDAGAFSFVVPNFHEDPFFRDRTKLNAGAFGLSSGTGTPDLFDETLRPSLLRADAIDAPPATITRVADGVLRGRLDRPFLRQQGLNDDLGAYDDAGLFYPSDHRPSQIAIGLYADAIDQLGPIDPSLISVPFHVTLEKNGTFQRQLPPGTYNLRLSLSATSGALQRTIWISKGLAIRENQRTVVDRP